MSASFTVTCAFEAKAILAEGPHYIDASHSLFWVDIPGHKFNILDLATKSNRQFDFPTTVGAAVPTSDGRVLLCVGKAFKILNTEVTNGCV
jgi:sugar lactone lactonase YvrE